MLYGFPEIDHQDVDGGDVPVHPDADAEPDDAPGPDD
jgi:hypothetical protein